VATVAHADSQGLAAHLQPEVTRALAPAPLADKTAEARLVATSLAAEPAWAGVATSAVAGMEEEAGGANAPFSHRAPLTQVQLTKAYFGFGVCRKGLREL